jgi:hypothetical protein
MPASAPGANPPGPANARRPSRAETGGGYLDVNVAVLTRHVPKEEKVRTVALYAWTGSVALRALLISDATASGREM